MNIIYSNNFLLKSSVSQQPMKGYWYQFSRSTGIKTIIELNSSTMSDDLMNLYFNTSQTYKSDIYYGNTSIINSDDGERSELSFTVASELVSKTFNCIYLYAVDMLLFDTIHDITDQTTLYNSMAAIILLDNESNFNYFHTNILDLKYVPKCSFHCLNSIQISHYMSEDIDRSNYYKANSNQFLNKESAFDVVRLRMNSNNPAYLNGHMTIDKSGVIIL